jgi:hypothetical protein
VLRAAALLSRTDFIRNGFKTRISGKNSLGGLTSESVLSGLVGRSPEVVSPPFRISLQNLICKICWKQSWFDCNVMLKQKRGRLIASGGISATDELLCGELGC